MSYQWPLDPADLFEERYQAIVALGVPSEDVDGVRASITDMWSDAPGGWVYEWSQLAKSYADAGEHLLASKAYGWAKFPTLADQPKRDALANQLEQYLLAAPGFGIDFERRMLQLPHQGDTVPVPVHLFTPAAAKADDPIVIASGGVDGWKMDVHGIMVQLADRLGMRVLAFDIAGTGESTVPMTGDGGGEIVRGLADFARGLGNGIVIHIGISMGGYYSARSGLAGDVDLAVDWGGPVTDTFKAIPSHYGMAGIIGNALGFSSHPAEPVILERFGAFDLQSLLDRDDNVPMLIINGDNDVHIELSDSTVFEGRRDTTVKLFAGSPHCAMDRPQEVLTNIADWIDSVMSSTRSTEVVR